MRDSPILGKAENGKLTIYEDGLARARLHAGGSLLRRATARCPRRSGSSSGDGDDWQQLPPTSTAIARRGLRRRGQGQAADLRRDQRHCSTAARGNDMLKGWHTNDTLRGGPGDDEINGSGGNDHIEGGDGNDKLRPDTYHGPGNDYVDGGAGIDTVDDWSIPDADYHPPVSVSMDGVANDGRPGEADNVVNVEKIESHVSGTLAGGPGDDEFTVWANVDEGNSTLLGNGGNDKLIAGDYQDTLDGGPGNDVLNARLRQRHDHRRAGPGHDLRRRHERLVRLVLLHVQDPVRQRRRQRPRRRGRHDRLRRRHRPRDRRRDRHRRQLRDRRRRRLRRRPGGPAGRRRDRQALDQGDRQEAPRRDRAVRQRLQGVRDPRRKGKKLATGRKTLLKAGNAKLTLKFAKQRAASMTAHAEGDGRGRRRQDELVEDGEAQALTSSGTRRVVSGAKISVRAAAVASEIAMSLPCAALHQPAATVARIEIGLTFTNASSPLGSVSGSTNTLDRNVSGKIPMKPAFMTAFGVRSSSPSVVNTHEQPEGEHDRERHRRDHARHAGVGPVAEDHAEHDDHRPGHEVAHGVAEQRADQRRRPPDRQRAEAVDDALGQVGVERDARVDGREQHRHHEDAGEDVVQVLAGRALDRTAEQVREHQDEHHRRDRHVQQLLGDVADLQHPAPAERERGGERARRAAGAGWRRARCAGRRRRCSCRALLLTPRRGGR